MGNTSSLSTLPRLPFDDADFTWLRDHGQVYVDKTRFIAQMLEEGLRFGLLCRPRRFGKSLLLSTMKSFFEGDASRFQGTYIHAQWAGPWSWHISHPVVRLNLGSMNFREPSRLQRSLLSQIEEACFDLGLNPPDTTLPPMDALVYLVRRAERAHGQKVVVLIDEYDSVITYMFGQDDAVKNRYMQQIVDEMRSFYGALKSVNHLLRFVFLTGISRFGQTGMFSSLNNLKDISYLPRYDHICGFTETEIQACFGMYIEETARRWGCTHKRVWSVLRHQYNGYRFTQYSEPIYNPFSLVNFFHEVYKDIHIQPAGELPRDWFQSGTPHLLYHLIRNRKYDIRELPTDPTGIHDACDLWNPDIALLMFQSGYLTLRPGGEKAGFVLDFPNHEVAYGFNAGLLATYLGRYGSAVGPLTKKLELMYRLLADGEYVGFCRQFNLLLDGTPYTLLKTESHYQLHLYQTCAFMRLLQVQAEVPTRYGRADAVVRTPYGIVVFELKLNQSAEAGLAQIRKRDYAAFFQSEACPIIGVGMNFNTPPKGRKDAWNAQEAKIETVHQQLYPPPPDYPDPALGAEVM